MEDHPARPRIAEVLVTKADGPWRGSGYLVASGWVLTAAHVVADASEVAVWLGSPPTLEPPHLGVGVDPRRILLANDMDKEADLALLPIGRSHTEPVEPVLFGRLDRTRNDEVPVAAAGCPRFKLRPAPRRPGVELRELHVAIGMIVAGSNVKTGTLELAVERAPAEDPRPEEHSPWEGMSGAAVWASGRLVGVVGQHHPRQGPGVLTVRPLTGLFEAVTPEQLADWQRALPQLGAGAEDLSPATLPSTRELVDWWAQQEAAELLPPVLVARDEELVALAAFAGSKQRWRWVQGAAFAGKTALLAWFALHPPEGVDVAACFLRRTASRADAGYALSILTSQLAHLADRSNDRSTSALYERVRDFRMLLEDAAQACRQRGRRLLVLFDGLDEDETVERGFAVAKWLPDATTLPDNAWLLVASRAGVSVPLPDGHPLTAHIHVLTPSVAASELQKLAKDELENARAAGGLVYDILGLLAAAIGGLTVSDLTELIRRHGQPSVSPVEVKDKLDGSLARSVSEVTDPEKLEQPVRVFAHDTLLDHARTLYIDQLPEFYALFDRWAQDYQQQGWPPTTPPYLLRSYTGQLASQARDPTTTPGRCRQVIETLYPIVTDPARSTRLLERTGNPAISDQEIATTQQLLINTRERAGIDDDELDYRLAVLALARRPLTGTLANVAASVSSVWAQTGRFRSALAIADDIVDPWIRARARAGVAITLAQVGQVDQAMSVAAGIDASRIRVAQALAGVVSSLARAGHVEQALKVANSIDDPDQRAQAMFVVAYSLARAGQVDQAMDLADQVVQVAADVDDPRARARLLTDAAMTSAWAGQFGQAINVASGIDSPEKRAQALAEVAGSLAQAGEVDRAAELTAQAVQVVAAVNDAAARAQALAGMAITLAQAGEVDQGAELATQAVQVASGVEDPGARAWALVGVAGMLALDRATDLAARAVQIASGIEAEGIRARALAEVADSLTMAGHVDQAADLAAQAARIASGIDDRSSRAQALAGAAGSLAGAGQFDQAIKVASGIDHPGTRAGTLAEVVGSLAKAGQVDQAIKLANGIDDRSPRARALAEVAGSLAGAGQFDEAINVVSGISDPDQRAQALAEVAGSLARARKADQAADLATKAVQIASGIEDPGAWAWALARVAGSLAQAREVEQAADLATKAVQIASGIEDPRARARVLSVVTASLTRIGQFDQAIEVASGIDHPGTRAGTLAGVAGNLARAGQVDQAIEVAISIDSWVRPEALAKVAGSLAQAGQVNRAINVTGVIDDLWMRARALAGVVGSLAQVGQFDEAISVASHIDEADERAGALGVVARSLAQVGQVDKAIEVAGGIENPGARARALAEVAGSLARAGEVEKAADLTAQAVQIAADVDDVAVWAPTPAEVTDSLARAGQFDLAIEVASGIDDADERARVLTDLADSLVQAGKADQAISVTRGIDDRDQRAVALAAVARSARAKGVDGSIRNAVHEALLSPYARDYLAALPPSVIKRLLAEEWLM